MSVAALQPDARVAFALLGAGMGARFGGGKLGADLAGRPLWRWAAESAAAAGFSQLHIVTNDAAIGREASAIGWIVHANPAAEEGVASSIRVAVAATPRSSRLVIALADMPFVEADHLNRLGRAQGVVFTRQDDGRDGVPAAFPRSAYAKLAALQGNRGAASLGWANSVSLDPASDESLADIDSPEDLDRARIVALRLRRAACR